jgi:radical SAM superfamily enzyme YgiQ (UPF0313 family)
MRILLLNPPSKNFIIRDYCCGHTSKADYCWPPIDLLVLSGILSQSHVINVLDSIIEEDSFNVSFTKILNFKPDYIISLTSAISLDDDMEFLYKIKKKINCSTFVIGDVAYFDPLYIMKNYKFLDGIIFDFTSSEILKFIEGERTNLMDMAYRKDKKIIICPKNNNKTFHYPIPKHELFSLKKYSLPYARYSPMTTVLFSYGCPYRCSFCNSGNLGFKKRTIDNLLEELKYIAKLGIKEIYFRDFSFTVNKERIKEICRQIIDNHLIFSWSCDARVNNVDEELLNLMKKSGCYLIFFGVESSSNEILKNVKKGTNKTLIKNVFNYCSKIGIQTLGSFIIGLPHDTKDTINDTLNFSIEINCDYASFNLFVPRYGSELWKVLTKKGIKEDQLALDSSSEVMPLNNMSKDELLNCQKMALKKFYLRPSYILKQLLKIRTKSQLKYFFKNGVKVFKNIIK